MSNNMPNESLFILGIALLLLVGACQQKVDKPAAAEPAPGFSQALSETDPTNRDFPGGRGADQLILYTPAFGDRTGTNKYGTEAVVIDGRITNISGNDSEIPKNGFVLSGHGKMSSWIAQNLQVGHQVKVADSRIYVTKTAQSDLYLADRFLKESMRHFSILPDENRNSAYDHYKERSDKQRSLAIKAEEEKQHDVAMTYAKSAVEEAKKAYYSSFPSREEELRACWYVIKETSPEELEKNIKAFAEIGFNAICPQIIYSGYAVYPNAHADLAQNPAFVGWDPLAELVRLCRKYDIKLIPWVWTYYVGRSQSPLAANKKDWLAESWRGEYGSRMEIDYHFFCASRPAVEDFWLQVYRDMLTRYDVDGLQLDYIRYPVSEPWENGYCYCTTCRDNFKSEHGRDPHTLTPDDETLWQEWNDYRVAQITRFVGRVRKLVDEVKPDLDLSADVFPVLSESLVNKQQNWGSWLDKGFMDELFIMSYTHDPGTVATEAIELSERTPDGTQGYVGLAPFMGLTPATLLEQILAAQEGGAEGITFFHYGSLSNDHVEALKLGPFKKKATLPN